MGVELRLLGDVSCLVRGIALDVGHRRQRSVLAALLVDANRPVPVDALIDRIWAEKPPVRVRTTLYGYVHHLRRALDATAEARVVSRPEGYCLAVDPAAVDVHRFRQLAERARADDDQALFDAALGLWRGEPFAGLESPWFDAVREHLLQERLAVEMDRNDAALRGGRHHRLLPTLFAMAEEHPLDERLAHQFMLAAYRSGRQDEALRRFDAIRARLADELGTDPGSTLRALHHRILTGDPELRQQVVARRPVPRQLPTPPRLFVGRTDELGALDRCLTAGSDACPAAAIAVVHGPRGIGKTALALRWAQARTHLFPDGQLYADLGGAHGDPAAALRGFLDALGVAPGAVPPDPGVRAALYRSLVAGRRVLVMVDDVADCGQVLPLLPGSAANTVLITSPAPLTDLVATHGAHCVGLGALGHGESRQLLAGHLGEQRVAAEPAAVVAVLSRSAGVPSALSRAAARALARPDLRLSAVDAEFDRPSTGHTTTLRRRVRRRPATLSPRRS
ncbi:AfsR/SARP family transcriptional regulator [Saccharothrix syringae]|uniref:AfsR/SARP family transcriptional regulator n=1 Tax=Saccharothrix syringae TaxID=103733 RepID=A0A5Q0H1P3_SACSY|nr:BTAD domain-containing putative transcriptional regulator [Saccharothrix syringae]QFZ20128.1 AfsR/SARP family transcriptional regulator [Saccharothrix syringae]